MSDYLNRANREAGICLAGCIGFSDVLLNTTAFRNADEVKKYLEIGHEAFQNALSALCEGLPPEQTQYMLKMADESVINVVPKTSPSAGRDWFPVCRDDMDVLLNAGAAAMRLMCTSSSTSTAQRKKTSCALNTASRSSFNRM